MPKPSGCRQKQRHDNRQRKTARSLGVPVVFAAATRGEGIYELVGEAVKVATHKPKPKHLKYRKDLEEKIEKLQHIIEKENLQLQYPARWIAIKLLEGDSEITKIVAEEIQTVVNSANAIAQELENSCQEKCFSIIASERYALASSIAASNVQQSEIWNTFSDKLEWVTTHRIFGLLYVGRRHCWFATLDVFCRKRSIQLDFQRI